MSDDCSSSEDTQRENPAAVAERYVRSEHSGVLDAVDEAATVVDEQTVVDEAATAVDSGSRWAEPPERPGRDGRALADALERELDDRGVLDRLPAVLSEAVEATGARLSAAPVPAPPYVAVTSCGPVLRGTTENGRLVVTLAAFAIERDPQVRYVRVSPVVVDAQFVGS